MVSHLQWTKTIEFGSLPRFCDGSGEGCDGFCDGFLYRKLLMGNVVTDVTGEMGVMANG
jgi:hypothetical protein